MSIPAQLHVSKFLGPFGQSMAERILTSSHLPKQRPRQIPHGKRSFNAPLIAKMLLIVTPASDRAYFEFAAFGKSGHPERGLTGPLLGCFVDP